MTRGVVAAGHEATATAAAGVLRDGGTAHDAVIAALAMACVAEPVLCTPGGTGFAMVRNGTVGTTTVVDFFAHTPLVRSPDAGEVREVFADFGTATQGFHVGPATTATPGFFAGLTTLHAGGATMTMRELFAPAIAAARDGVVVTAFQHHLATVVAPILTDDPRARALFAPDGDVLPVGHRFTNPGLADALAVLSADGFASSGVGRACLDAQAGRGHLTAADLESYRTFQRTPLAVELDGATVHLNPPPAASGPLVAHTLGGLASTGSLSVARALAATDDARRRGDVALDHATIRTRGTTHVSVVDEHGTAVSATVSNGEGNGELVGEFGFMLNNVLGEEDVNPDGDGWPTDVRLSSMMCPTMIDHPDGALTVLGSGGSNRIRSAIAQVVARLCLDGNDVSSAVEAPRLHVEGGHLDFEDLVSDADGTALRDAFPDHLAWPRPDLFYGGVHAVHRDATGTFSGAGDQRRDGAAIVVD